MPRIRIKPGKHCRWCGGAYTAKELANRNGFCGEACMRKHFLHCPTCKQTDFPRKTRGKTQ